MTAPGQCAAWDVYLSLTTRLLPALHSERVDDVAVNAELGGVAIRIFRYASLWGEHGGMLVAAVHSAVRLYGTDDSRDDLAGLLRVIADRLYLLSAGGGQPRGDRTPP